MGKHKPVALLREMVLRYIELQLTGYTFSNMCWYNEELYVSDRKQFLITMVKDQPRHRDDFDSEALLHVFKHNKGSFFRPGYMTNELFDEIQKERSEQGNPIVSETGEALTWEALKSYKTTRRLSNQELARLREELDHSCPNEVWYDSSNQFGDSGTVPRRYKSPSLLKTTCDSPLRLQREVRRTAKARRAAKSRKAKKKTEADIGRKKRNQKKQSRVETSTPSDDASLFGRTGLPPASQPSSHLSAPPFEQSNGAMARARSWGNAAQSVSAYGLAMSGAVSFLPSQLNYGDPNEVQNRFFPPAEPTPPSSAEGWIFDQWEGGAEAQGDTDFPSDAAASHQNIGSSIGNEGGVSFNSTGGSPSRDMLSLDQQHTASHQDIDSNKRQRVTSGGVGNIDDLAAINIETLRQQYMNEIVSTHPNTSSNQRQCLQSPEDAHSGSLGQLLDPAMTPVPWLP